MRRITRYRYNNVPADSGGRYPRHRDRGRSRQPSGRAWPRSTGAARYPSDVCYPDLAHAALVQSAIAAGTISGIDAGQALAAPGVLAVIPTRTARR